MIGVVGHYFPGDNRNDFGDVLFGVSGIQKGFDVVRRGSSPVPYHDNGELTQGFRLLSS